MIITFKPLNKSHFPLLLKWLEAGHIKKWWGSDVTYTIDLIKEKYSSYVKGYKVIDGVRKPIQGFIIHVDQTPIGYIQIYNAYDFPRSKPLLGLPQNLGSFDIFIGEVEYLRQNLGSKAISKFLELYVKEYSHIFADPDADNLTAIKCYKKAGFKRLLEKNDVKKVWMIKELSSALNMRNAPLQTIREL